MNKHKTKLLAGCLVVTFFMTTVFSSNAFAATSRTQSLDPQTVSSEQRLFGLDRYETAAKIVQEGWKGASEYAVLSAGMDDNLVDALAAAPLAKLKNAPVLLTEGEVLNKYAEAELVRLGVKTVYVTTGDKVIREKVLNRLSELNITVVPLGGSDRYETALNIAKQMGTFNKFVVATAWNNADALSVASIAAAKGMPILLSDVNKIPDIVKAYIDEVKNNVSQTYILGGTGALTDNVKNALPNATRIGGMDRFGTNLEVLKTFANDLKYSKTYLANGEDDHLADALAGSPLAAQTASPVLLTGAMLPSESKEFAKLNLGSNIITFGGEAVVPAGVVKQLDSAIVYSEDGVTVGSADANQIMDIAESVRITAKNMTLKNAKSAYSIYIQGDNVVLDNVTVIGTLFIDPGENGTANINNVKAGKIVVLSGAKESIHLKNTEAGTLVVSSSSEVRVESSGTTKVGNTVVTSYAILDAAGGSLGSVEVVSVAGEAPVVTFKGTFDQPIVVSGAATIKADVNASIAKLEISPENKDQIITLDGKFTTVEVNKEAQVNLSSNTTVTNVVTNVKTELNVPSGASIENLDKKGNEVPVSGSGSVGGSTPSAGGGGGSSSGGDTTQITKSGSFGANGQGGVDAHTTLTYTLGENYTNGQVVFKLPSCMVAVENDFVGIAGAEEVGISSENISDNGHTVTISGVTASKGEEVTLKLFRDIEIGRWDFNVIGDCDGNGPKLQIAEPKVSLYRPDFTQADDALNAYLHAGGNDRDPEFVAVTEAMDGVIEASHAKPWNQVSVDAACEVLKDAVDALKAILDSPEFKMVDATIGQWSKDRTEPKSWEESEGWITLTTTAQQNSNSWYDWQGRGAVTNVGPTDMWKVETQVELTDELLNGTGVRTSLWVQVDGVNGTPNTQNNVLDWAILQYNNDPSTHFKGWESWDSTKGTWEPISDVSVEKGNYTLKMLYDKGKLSQYINGKLARAYNIEVDEGFGGVSTPSCLIIQSRTFGQEYTAKWKVPTVKYIKKYPAGTKFISNEAELTAAINAQAEGQTWVLKNGTYNTPRFDNITQGGQTGWYFPITANNITIIGESKENVILTSNVESANGNWASQDHISVWGNNVTIKNLTIKPKIETNKTIEVMGQNFTLNNVDFIQREDQTEQFAGSLYFNPQNPTKDIGNAFVENVLINDAWISCGEAVTSGSLTIKNSTIDFRGSAYANAYGGYGVISKNPVIKVVNGSSLKVYVDNSLADLQKQVLDRVPAGTKVILEKGTYYVLAELKIPDNVTLDSETNDAEIVVINEGEVFVKNVTELNSALKGDATTIYLAPGTYVLDSQIRISKAINIIGSGDSTVITKGNTPWTNATGSKGYASIISIVGVNDPVVLQNIKVTGATNITMTSPGSGTDYGSGINIVSSSVVKLINVTSTNNAAAGLVVNSSTVTAENLNTKGNGWYGVNVDQKDSGEASFTLTGNGVIDEGRQIISDVTTGTVVNADGYKLYQLGDSKASMWTNRPVTKAATITKVNGTSTSTILYSTIQAAIDGAGVGDTIDVCKGTYDANIKVNKKVILKGVPNKESIINGEIHLTAGSSGSTIEGFTINIGTSGYAVNCDTGIGDVTISNNVMNANPNGETALAVYINAGWGDKNVVTGNTFSGFYSEAAITIEIFPDPSTVVTEVKQNTFSNIHGEYLKVYGDREGRLVTDIKEQNDEI